MDRAIRRAFADEWAAHYNFEAAAWASRKHRALFAAKSAMALRRARRLAAAGGTPPLSFGRLFEATTDKPFPLGEGLLAAALDAERTSVRTYRRLARSRKHGRLGRALLAEARREVRRLANLV